MLGRHWWMVRVRSEREKSERALTGVNSASKAQAPPPPTGRKCSCLAKVWTAPRFQRQSPREKGGVREAISNDEFVCTANTTGVLATERENV